MKRYIIADTHGKKSWEQVKEVYKDGDEVYFLGDYFDDRSFDGDEVTDYVEQIGNFHELMEWAEEVGAIVLLGNHDLSYFMGEPVTGEHNKCDHRIRRLIKNAIASHLKQLKIVHVTEDNIVLSHAGVCNKYDPKTISIAWNIMNDNVIAKDNEFSPVWIRPDTLYENPIECKMQVVGHTITAMRERFNHIDEEIIGEEVKYNGGVATVPSFIRQGNVWHIDTCGTHVFVLPEEKKVYDKVAIMKRASTFRKEGLNKREALKKAWAEAR